MHEIKILFSALLINIRNSRNNLMRFNFIETIRKKEKKLFNLMISKTINSNCLSQHIYLFFMLFLI